MNKDTGGQAFPGRPMEAYTIDRSGMMQATYLPGMTLRDYFAAKAMQAMVASPSYYIDGWAHSHIAIQSYQMADAMIKARNK